MKVDIGIIGALEEEVQSLISCLSSHTREVVGGIEFHTGEIHSRRVAIARCGIGKVFAAMCAEAMIIAYKPDLIVNTGVGGALADGLATGDVVVATKLVQHDMDTSPIGDPKGLVSGINKVFFETDSRCVHIIEKNARALGLRVSAGCIASGDQFIAAKEDKERIVSEFSAAVCEMEGAAVAQVAYVNETDVCVIRAISDSADGDATMDYPTFMPIAAKNSAKLTLSLIAEF